MKTPTHIKSGSGFSLVELLVVIAVIAIIAAIAIPNIAGITSSARESNEAGNANNVAKMWMSYRTDYYKKNSTYPTASSISDVVTQLAGGNLTLTGTNNAGVYTNTYHLPGLDIANVATNKLNLSGGILTFTP